MANNLINQTITSPAPFSVYLGGLLQSHVKKLSLSIMLISAVIPIKSTWERVFATEDFELMVNHAFFHMNLRRIYATVNDFRAMSEMAGGCEDSRSCGAQELYIQMGLMTLIRILHF